MKKTVNVTDEIIWVVWQDLNASFASIVFLFIFETQVTLKIWLEKQTQ